MAGIVDYLLELAVPSYQKYGGPGNSGQIKKGTVLFN